LGEKDQALDRLQTAFDDRSAGLVYLKMDPAFDALCAATPGCRPAAPHPVLKDRQTWTVDPKECQSYFWPFSPAGRTETLIHTDGGRLALMAGVVIRSGRANVARVSLIRIP
jgi:hypothetical protein